MRTKSIFGAPPVPNLPAAPSPLAAVLAVVAGHFQRAAAGGPNTIPEIVAGIRALAHAPTLARGYPEPAEATAIVTAVRASVGAVCDATGESVPHEQVILGLAAAENLAAMFGRTPAELTAGTPIALGSDFLDEAMLLGDLLDADCRRRAIAARGNPFRRMIAIRRALADTGDGAALH